MRNTQFVILNADDSMTQTGNSFWVGQICSGSFVPSCGDATAAGTLKLQASNQSPASTTAPTKFTPASTSWADIPNATSTIASGAGPAIVIPNMAFAYIRAVFTHSGGGSTKINVDANVIGV